MRRLTLVPLLVLLPLAAACVTEPEETPASSAGAAAAPEPGREQASTPPRPWTRTFLQPAVLVAREVTIEGPAGLLEHVALVVDPELHDYSVRTVPEGLLQELGVKPDQVGAVVICHLDRLEIAAEERVRVLERPGDVPVTVTATGEAVWQTPEGAEKRGEVLRLVGVESQ